MTEARPTGESNDPLGFDRRDGVVILTLNRPAARNALNGALLESLHSHLDHIARDPAIGVVMLRGAGGYFCAGGDLKERRDLPLTGEGSLQQRSVREGELLARIADMPQLTVAAVESGAVGAGLGMLCACDSVVAAGRCHFATPEILTGKMPAQIAPYVIAAAGWRQGRKLLLTGRRIDSEEACRIGIVDELVPEGTTLEQAIAEMLDGLAGINPQTMAHTKALLRKAATVGRGDYARIAAKAYASLEQRAQPL